MQQLLEALHGAARAEVVPTELLGQFLVAVHDPESAPNLRLGRVSLSSAYLTARKEGRLSNSPWRAMSGLLSKPRAAGSWLSAWPGGQGRGVSQKWEIPAGGIRLEETACGELLAFGRNGRPEAIWLTAGGPSPEAVFGMESARRDCRDCRLARPGPASPPYASGILSIPLRRFGDCGAFRVR
jgi:hypothetical protein